jgi:hypothetical protein
VSSNGEDYSNTVAIIMTGLVIATLIICITIYNCTH